MTVRIILFFTISLFDVQGTFADTISVACVRDSVVCAQSLDSVVPVFSLQMKTDLPKVPWGSHFVKNVAVTGMPLFAAGILFKSKKYRFRQDYRNQHDNTRLVDHFKTRVDDHLQYAPLLGATSLHFAGVEGKSDHFRYVVSAGMSYALMAGLVNALKYSTRERRPDGSTSNSWPSGHTATAFAGATILHREYGLTRSPWYSVAGYAMATATGVMRVLNNRHWFTDVLSGAGVGIVSTEMAYALSNLIFKSRHQKRSEVSEYTDVHSHPSFFDLGMGVGLGRRDLAFRGSDLGIEVPGTASNLLEMKFAAGTAITLEGAYFLNRYVGLGGRLRVNSFPIRGWQRIYDLLVDWKRREMRSLATMDVMQTAFQNWEMTIESDHITEFTANGGVYFSIPLSQRFALGCKLLAGRSVMQELDINYHLEGRKVLTTGSTWTNGEPYQVDWDFLKVGGSRSISVGTGVSLTYACRNNMSWKVFCDYDYTRKRMTMTYNPDGYFTSVFDEDFVAESLREDVNLLKPRTSRITKRLDSFVLGAALSVSF